MQGLTDIRRFLLLGANTIIWLHVTVHVSRLALAEEIIRLLMLKMMKLSVF